MGILNQLFGQKQDPWYEKAVTLLQAARASAVGIFVPLLDRFPVLQRVDVVHSDYIFTVASVFLAATRLNNLRIDDTREEKLMEIIATQLAEWESGGLQAFDDCKRVFEAEFDRLTAAENDPRFVAADALGLWITLNLLGNAPETEEESKLVRASGILVVHTFFNWWQ